MRKVVPLDEENKHKMILFNKDYDTNEIKDEERNLAGHAATRQLKLVCRSCNSNWMGDLERDVEPIFTPLILGQDKVLLEADQLTISKWAVLKTMLGEYLDIPRRRVIGLSEKRRFYETGKIGDGWQVLLGKVSDGNYNYFHGAGLMSHTLIKSKSALVINNTQCSVFTIGNLLIYTYCAPFPEYNYFILGEWRSKVAKLYPYKGKVIDTKNIITLENKEEFDLKMNHKYYTDLWQISGLPPNQLYTLNPDYRISTGKKST